MRNKKLLALFLVLTLVITVSGCGSKKVDKKDSTVESTEERETLDDNSSIKEEDNDKTDASETIEDESNNIDIDKNESEPSNENSTSGSGTGNSGSSNNSSGATGSTNSGNSGSSGSTNNTGNNNNSGSSNNSGSNNTGSNSGSTTTTPSEPVHEHTWTEVTEDEIHYYAWRTICNVCKTDMTDMTDDELTWHVAAVCGGSYANYYKEVDFVTENVVKTPVVVGYKCECGAEKK